MDKKYVYIYTLASSSSPNEIRYVGKTNNINKRLKRHTSNYYLNESTYKANWVKSILNNNDSLIIEVLDIVLEDEWEFWEIHWIALIKSWGYKLTNGTFGGEGIKLTKEIIDKRSKSNMGKVLSPEHREKLSKANKGKKMTEEAKENLRQKNLGKKYSDETKQKLSEMRKGEKNSRYGKKNSEEHKLKSKMNHPFRTEILQLDLNGLLIDEFVSIHEASKITGIHRSLISRCCRGLSKKSKGFIWKYKEK